MTEVTVVLLFRPGYEPPEDELTDALEEMFECDVIGVEVDEY